MNQELEDIKKAAELIASGNYEANKTLTQLEEEARLYSAEINLLKAKYEAYLLKKKLNKSLETEGSSGTSVSE